METKREGEREGAGGYTVFLTGGTGFLGSFLLLELLKRLEKGKKMTLEQVSGKDPIVKPLEKVICLVRGPSHEACKIRLWESLQNWFGNSSEDSPENITPSLEDCFSSNVFAVPGDISLPNLGLSSEDWNNVTREFDSVIHNGAAVHLSANFNKLEDANVNSIREVIRMARESRKLFPKKEVNVHFVSSVGVGIICHTNSGKFGEWVVPECVQSLPTADSVKAGYALTKYIGERLLMAETQSGDFSAKIYRAGVIIGSSVSGKGSSENLFTFLVQAAALFGKVPYLPGPAYLVPVDVVANSIISIALDSSSKNVYKENVYENESKLIRSEDKVEMEQTSLDSKTNSKRIDKKNGSLEVLHIVPSESQSFDSISEVLKKNGFKFEVIPTIEDWTTELTKGMKTQRRLAQFYPIISILKRLVNQPGPRFSSSQTDEALKNVGLSPISHPTESALMAHVKEIRKNLPGIV